MLAWGHEVKVTFNSVYFRWSVLLSRRVWWSRLTDFTPLACTPTTEFEHLQQLYILYHKQFSKMPINVISKSFLPDVHNFKLNRSLKVSQCHIKHFVTTKPWPQRWNKRSLNRIHVASCQWLKVLTKSTSKNNSTNFLWHCVFEYSFLELVQINFPTITSKVACAIPINHGTFFFELVSRNNSCYKMRILVKRDISKLFYTLNSPYVRSTLEYGF